MNNRIKLFNCPIDKYTMQETLNIIEKAIKENIQLHHVVVNVAKFVNMQKNKELYDSVT